MVKISILDPGKYGKGLDPTSLIPEPEQQKERQVSLQDIQSAVSKGVPILGWLYTFSIGGLRVPCDIAEQLLADNGYEYDEYLRRPSAIDAYRQTMSAFKYEDNQWDLQDIQTPEGFQKAEIKIIHRYTIEKTNGMYYLIYRKVEPNFSREIESIKLARLDFDEHTNAIVPRYIETDKKDFARELIESPLMPNGENGIMLEYSERRSTYHDMHIRQALLKIIEQMYAIRWADNGTYFVPQTATLKLEDIRNIVDGLKPYKTSEYKDKTVALPIPDVEELMGPKDSEGYRKAISDALEADLTARLKEMTAKLADTLNKEGTKETIKLRNLRNFNSDLQDLRDRTKQYEALLQSGLTKAKDLCDIAFMQIKKIVDEGKVEAD